MEVVYAFEYLGTILCKHGSMEGETIESREVRGGERVESEGGERVER